jgi:hypothetical protein
MNRGRPPLACREPSKSAIAPIRMPGASHPQGTNVNATELRWPRSHETVTGTPFEPGCSVGELTALLAPRCDRLLATDAFQTAVERARQRCAEFGNARIRCSDLRKPELGTPLDRYMISL